jgi:hypothetical protein
MNDELHGTNEEAAAVKKTAPKEPSVAELLEQAAALLEKRTERVKRSRSLAAEVRRLAEKAADL